MEWLGTGEPDGSGLVGCVDDFLDVGEKFRRLLDFVDENGRTIALEKERRVLLCRLQDGGVVESHVGSLVASVSVFFHEVFKHSCLAHLAWTGDYNNFEVL